MLAVEPHDDMRRVLDEKKLHGVESKNGLSTSIPSENESVDAVIAAQAFHWFANMDSLKEIHRVLKPHGVLGMIWNVEDYNAPQSHKATTSWEQAMQDHIFTQDDDQPRFRHEQWRKVFDDQLATGPMALITAAEPIFALPLGIHEEQWKVYLEKDRVWDRLCTLSQIAITEGKERERVRKLFFDAVEAEDTEVDDQGRVAVHGATYTAWTSSIPTTGASKLWEKQS